MINNRIYIYITTILFLNIGLYGQNNLEIKDKLLIKQANECFDKSDVIEAKKNYESLLRNPKTAKYGNYGLGLCSLKENDGKKALEYFYNLVEKDKDLTKEEKHSVYHNMGNIMYMIGDYAKAIDYYETSLINNPKDDETRYNLVMAQKMLNKQKSQNNNNNSGGGASNNNNKNDENNDNKTKNEDLKNNSSNAKKQDISDKEAEQLLQIFKQDEQKTRERILKKNDNNTNKNKKNW